jgi:hypothetical protein
MSIRFGGGLNVTDSPEAVADDECYAIRNFQLQGIGRATTRRALRSIGTVLGGEISGIFSFPFGTDVTGGAEAGVVYIVKLSPTGVRLSVADQNGQNATIVGTLPGSWASTGSQPMVTAATMNGKLFLVDESQQHGLAIYDPELPSGKLWQPEFSFAGSAAQPLRGRVITQYNNMLFVAGYGTEDDADRPEVVRFSYLGLVFDSEGAGDAGDTGSENLFDIDDYFMVGERGTAVVSMVPASGRLIIATEKAVYSLFGYDRSTFQLDLLDNQRGCVATRAMVEAGGDVFWWSPLGPCMYSGGQVIDIGHKILDRLHEVRTDTMFAVHDPATYEVRFYYALTTSGEDPDRAFVYNYAQKAWTEHRYGTDSEPVRFFCGGMVRPSPTAPPAAAPTLTAADAQDTNVSLYWDNGDASPGIRTIIQLSEVSSAGQVNTSGTTVTAIGFTFVGGDVGKYITVASGAMPAAKVTAIGGGGTTATVDVSLGTLSNVAAYFDDTWVDAATVTSGVNQHTPWPTPFVLSPQTVYMARVAHRRGGTTTDYSARGFTTLQSPEPPTTNTQLYATPISISTYQSPANLVFLHMSVMPTYSDNPWVEVQLSTDGSTWGGSFSLFQGNDGLAAIALHIQADFGLSLPYSGSTVHIRARHIDGYGNHSEWISTSTVVQ